MSVISLYSEPTLMEELSGETLELIHATTAMAAIKRLVTAHDILNLNLEIMKNFEVFEGFPPWDISALQDFNTIRRELVCYYHVDFRPPELLLHYNQKAGTLLRLVGLRVAPQLLTG